MKHLRKVVYIVVVLSAAGLLTCSDSESKFRPLPGQSAVIISLSLPPENPTAFDDTILNRIRRIFVREAMAQTAPAVFSTIAVTVTGPDITAIQQTFSPGATITLNVPAGNVRRFDVLAAVASGDPSAALSFSGTTVSNLPEGQTVSLPVLMLLNETKIVLPDPGPSSQQNNRIIQIDNISGTGYIIKTGANIGFTGTFRPWDVDFDSRGRIYIATNGFATGDMRVIRINNINSASNSLIADNGLTGVIALAVDKVRNYVYFSPSNPATATVGFRRCNLDGTGATGVLPVTGVETINTITGMDVDSTSGLLYISGKNVPGQDRIFQYDPVAQIVTRVFSANLNGPEDVRVMAPFIYVANPLGATNFKIIQLDSNLNFVAGYGSQAGSLPNTSPGQFYGPRHFVGIRNDSLIVMDDIPTGQDFDKLASITNITGAGWTTYPVSGADTGQSLFKFYYGC